MLLIKTEVKPSTIVEAGLGLFAVELIAKGTRIWEFTKGFDLILTPNDLATLTPIQQQFIQSYAYHHSASNSWVLCTDNDRFINHSPDPNVHDSAEDLEDGFSTAARDIQPGEELLCDYRQFDADFAHKLKFKK